MSAAAPDAALSPTPSALLRRPARGVPAMSPPLDPSVTLVGELAEDAHTCAEPATGRAGVTVMLAQRQGRPPVLATMWLQGDGHEAAWHALERAAALRRGQLVEARGSELNMRWHRGALAIVLGTVRHLEPVQTPQSRPPQEAPAP